MLSKQEQLMHVDTTSAAEKLEQIKQDYPEYYRAWRTMVNNGINEVIPAWRGTSGLIEFIEDTSTLPDSPDMLPDIGVKLKRKLPAFQFDKDNVYWKIPATQIRRAAKVKATAAKLVVDSRVVQHPAQRDTDCPSSITALKQLYPTQEAIEARMDTLFKIQFEGGGLSELQTVELDVLGTISKGEPIEPLDKFTDV